jgi:hypothetical protein
LRGAALRPNRVNEMTEVLGLPPQSAMTGNLITTILAVLFGLLVLGTVGTFLLLVPALSLISVASILLAMIFMFTLGCHAGGRRIRLSHVRRLIHH